jgi:hypothetical protein
MTKYVETELSAADRKQFDSLFAAIQKNLDEVGSLIGKRLAFKEAKAKRITFSVSERRAKCCEEFPDGTCGCVEIPPGISRVCGPGEP